MVVDHAGGLRHNLAIIEGDEEQVAGRGKADVDADWVNGGVEDVGRDGAEKGFIAGDESADLDSSHCSAFILRLYFCHKTLTFT
ncbi:hypothetical protein GCM10023067_35410 [Aminobacter aganoensis]